MRTLEDRLNNATDDIRHQIDQVDIRPAATIGRRVRQRRALMGTAAIVLVVGALGGTALIAGNGETAGFAPGGVGDSPATTIVAPVEPAVVPVAPAVQDEGRPRLGIVSDDWAILQVADFETATKIVYVGNPAVYGDQARTGRASMETIRDTTETQGFYEGDPDAAGIQARIALHIGEDTPSDALERYERALVRFAASEDSLGEVDLNGVATGQAFTFTDPNTDLEGFAFIWLYSDTVTVEAIAYVDTFEDATDVVGRIATVSAIRGDWTVDYMKARTAATSDGSDRTSPTTTIVMAGTPLAQGLQSTPLTIAWQQWVTDAMEAVRINAQNAESFEQGSDRGLVHTTFTADEIVWDLSFGPWREGEYSGDAELMQEQFFAGEPGTETDEGLLFIATERPSPPRYVVLAMDTGKIVISAAPLSTASEAPPIEMLEDLALAAAPTVRQLLEANLIEWTEQEPRNAVAPPSSIPLP